MSQALLQNLSYCPRHGAILGLVGINAPLNIHALMSTFNRIRIIVAQLRMKIERVSHPGLIYLERFGSETCRRFIHFLPQ